MRIKGSLCDVVAGLDLVPDLHEDLCAVSYDVGSVSSLFSYDHLCPVVVSGLDGDDFSVSFADLCQSLRLTCFKELFYSGKTADDVIACNSAGVECSHGQLCTGFTDGLSCDDTNSFADVHRFICGQVSSVALSADTCSALAGHDGADSYLLDACLFDG